MLCHTRLMGEINLTYLFILLSRGAFAGIGTERWRLQRGVVGFSYLALAIFLAICLSSGEGQKCRANSLGDLEKIWL